MKTYGFYKLAMLLIVAVLVTATIACEQAPKEPPPDRAVQVMQGIKAAYNADDADAFTD